MRRFSPSADLFCPLGSVGRYTEGIYEAPNSARQDDVGRWDTGRRELIL